MLIKEMLTIVVLFALAFALLGCGTVYRGTSQEIMILSDPIGARATIDQKVTVITPEVVSLSRRKSHDVKFEKEGYEPAQTQLRKKVDVAIAANIMLGGWGILTGIIDYGTGGGCILYPKDAYVKLQEKEGELTDDYSGSFMPVNVDQGRVLKARKRVILIVTDRSGKCFMGNLYGLQDNTLLLCSLSWGEKPIGIDLSAISKIEVERRSDIQRWFIDSALITDLAFSAIMLPYLKYDLDYFLVMISGPTLGFIFGGPFGSLVSMINGANIHINFSTLPEPDRAKTVMRFLGID